MKTRIVAILLSLTSLTTQAAILTCPDPQTTSLKWGEPPKPWLVDPFSPNRPQGEDNTQFIRANIMVAGIGRGVVCSYKNSIGLYSIWWPVRVKVPAREDYRWIDTVGGFVCTESLSSCQFSVETD